MLWLTSVTFRTAGKSTIYLSFAASTVVFKAKVLHFVRSHEITKDAKTESLDASLDYFQEIGKHTDPCGI